MASEFQEISHRTRPETSLATIAPEPFHLNLDDDATNQIDFIFALNNRPDHHLAASDSSQQQARDYSDSSAPHQSSISAVDNDDDDDGFRTPTSSDHKIPVVKHCPPAPSRPKPISWSRTLPRATSGVRRGFRIYISDEIVDSIFCSDFLLQKTKKARKDDNGGE